MCRSHGPGGPAPRRAAHPAHALLEAERNTALGARHGGTRVHQRIHGKLGQWLPQLKYVESSAASMGRQRSVSARLAPACGCGSASAPGSRAHQGMNVQVGGQVTLRRNSRNDSCGWYARMQHNALVLQAPAHELSKCRAHDAATHLRRVVAPQTLRRPAQKWRRS